MTFPFWCLFVAILLPYVFSGVSTWYRGRQFGSVDNHRPRAQSAALEGAGARAWAAQQNAWEALAVFGSAVFVAHLAGAAPGASAIASAIFIVARILHGVFYVSDVAPLRSLMFGVATVCCVWLFGLAAVA